MDNQNQNNTQNTILDDKNVENLLGKFAQSDYSDIDKPSVQEIQKDEPTLHSGFLRDSKYKIDNKSAQILLERMRKDHNLSDRSLLAMYFALDKALEDGVLNPEMLDYLQKNPSVIDHLLEKEKNETE